MLVVRIDEDLFVLVEINMHAKPTRLGKLGCKA